MTPLALSFDCYGTLIDWETGIVAALAPWVERAGIELGEEELLQAFATHETAVERQHQNMPYPEVLAETLRRIGTQHGEVTDAEAAAFGDSVGAWPPFADSTDALRRLQERFRLVILSNVDRRSFAATQAALGVTFDLVVTAEEAGAYKPDSAGFYLMFDRLHEMGIERDRLLHVAQSLFHDHEPARLLGLPSIWIDRRAGRAGGGATPPPAGTAGTASRALPRYPSMKDFADAMIVG